MKVSQALLQRRSCRAFLETPVETDKIVQILEHARWAPSGVNMQPWQVTVLTGQAKQRLSDALLNAFTSEKPSVMDYQYYPLQWQEPYKGRQRALGKQMFELLNISRDDKSARLTQWGRNYLGFDAPCLLIFSIDASLEKGAYLDYGMFLQSVMLMAEELGLASCPQASLAEHPDLLREFLGCPENEHFICGIALGYKDKEALVNQLQPPREDVQHFCRFLDD
ncbi:nitroreductase [Thiosulfatimonas sediminis]|uniref:Nitroreductase n=1 Tax=Thiosulfatimonas sediminis TaxID=2675054 RepID=A0A6F8PUV9_9GAMM|nr:nitroreductase [Thiosulfatimonas sediminis]BBP45817.1 nitroreductase [Thiosulfatimonas sediminis]